jgi:hypothetical protein
MPAFNISILGQNGSTGSVNISVAVSPLRRRTSCSLRELSFARSWISSRKFGSVRKIGKPG